MRKLLGKWGAIPGPLPYAATLLLLITSSFLFTMPATAHAQIWISSGFKAAADGVNEIAFCRTSAVDPNTMASTPAAADYKSFAAACTVTPSTGAAITSTQCPKGDPYFNPKGLTCRWEPDRGVRYSICATAGSYLHHQLHTRSLVQYGSVWDKVRTAWECGMLFGSIGLLFFQSIHSMATDANLFKRNLLFYPREPLIKPAIFAH
jgi:hypothetical protein